MLHGAFERAMAADFIFICYTVNRLLCIKLSRVLFGICVKGILIELRVKKKNQNTL